MSLTLRLASLVSVAIPLLHGSFATAQGEPRSHRVYEWVAFQRRQLTDVFYCEGSTYGDVNRDGHIDVIVGPFWYAGPDFNQRHRIYPPQAFPTNGYSDNFLMFTHDFNADGWLDVLVVGYPGAEAWWYENPGSASGPWARHLVFDVVDNESPVLGDLTGDGEPELIFHTSHIYGYAVPDRQHPVRRWAFQPISEPIAGGRYTHGLGYGDVNGDGRADLLTKEGWLEQPESLEGNPNWTFHPFPFAEAASQMYAYDFDGDGDQDIFTALHCHAYGLAWYEQVPGTDGKVDFRQHVFMGQRVDENAYGVAFSQAHAVAMADIDGDGILDVVTGKRFWAHNGNDPGANDPAVLYWFRTVRHGPGDVDFVPYLVDDDSGVGTQVTVGDVSGDGRPDIVVGNKKGTFVFLQQLHRGTREEWLQAQPRRYVPAGGQ